MSILHNPFSPHVASTESDLAVHARLLDVVTDTCCRWLTIEPAAHLGSPKCVRLLTWPEAA